MATNGYLYNQTCRCTRCRMHGLMGPAILITLGIVFLSRHEGIYIVPALLIVVGVVKLLQSNAPTEGHTNPYVVVNPVQPMPMQPSPMQPPPPEPPR
ncbi:MAG: hypothetical protein ABI383_04215, partial [Acidobacteriaceae bacterium]